MVDPAQESSSTSSETPSESAMVCALKRTLIEQDSALKSAQRRNDELENSLTMEKREHQLTTAKLSQLLKKRGNSGGGGPDHEKEVASLRQHVSLLQQQLLLAEEREGKLSQQLSASLTQ